VPLHRKGRVYHGRRAIFPGSTFDSVHNRASSRSVDAHEQLCDGICGGYRRSGSALDLSEICPCTVCHFDVT